MPAKLKVLLIEDNAKAADAVEKMLSVAEVPSPAVTIERAEDLKRACLRLDAMAFDAILLDLNLPDSKGIETLASIRPHRGNAALVVLTASEEEEMAFAALREGADEYLVKGDVTGAAFVRRLHLAIERRIEKLRGEGAGPRHAVLGFCGAKGGVGTTTVVLNVAAALAKQNRSTIVIELRPDFGMFSYQLKHEPTLNLGSFRDVGPERVDAAAVAERLCSLPLGLRALFGPQRPEEFGDLDPRLVSAIIRAASSLAECVVIDLPPATSAMAQAAIRECHFVSIILERDQIGVHAAKTLQQLLRTWGISQLITGAVVVNRSVALTPMVINTMVSQLGCGILGVVPPAVELCTRCHQAGSPAVFQEPESTFSATLVELTQRILDGASQRVARTRD